MHETTPSLHCTETARTFATSKEARTSEVRFREIQAACDAGRLPELRKGDVIYVDTEIYLSRRRDDFRVGLAEVIGFRMEISAGKPVPFLCVAQKRETCHILQNLPAA